MVSANATSAPPTTVTQEVAIEPVQQTSWPAQNALAWRSVIYQQTVGGSSLPKRTSPFFYFFKCHHDVISTGCCF